MPIQPSSRTTLPPSGRTPVLHEPGPAQGLFLLRQFFLRLDWNRPCINEVELPSFDLLCQNVNLVTDERRKKFRFLLKKNQMYFVHMYFVYQHIRLIDYLIRTQLHSSFSEVIKLY